MSRLTIDLDALAHNYAVLRDVAGAEVAPVVKADGYGMGAGPVARRLWAEGARRFYVARLEEGEALRAALEGRTAQIGVFDGVTPGAAPRLEAADLTPVLNSLPQIEAWVAHASGRRLPAALHIDTGMNRLGLRVEEARALATSDHLRDIELTTVMSHLACAPEPDHALNALQRDRFAAVRALFPKARASFANSAGAFLDETYRFDEARPGISLYGGGPRERPDGRLKAVATLEAPILQVRAVPVGESIGYGADFVADRPLRIAVLGAGYADGLLRAWSPSGRCWFKGARRRLLGRISMDLLAVDVTDCEAQAGELVELLGPNIALDDAAAAARTTAYELLVRLAPRAERVYRGETG